MIKIDNRYPHHVELWVGSPVVRERHWFCIWYATISVSRGEIFRGRTTTDGRYYFRTSRLDLRLK